MLLLSLFRGTIDINGRRRRSLAHLREPLWACLDMHRQTVQANELLGTEMTNERHPKLGGANSCSSSGRSHRGRGRFAIQVGIITAFAVISLRKLGQKNWTSIQMRRQSRVPFERLATVLTGKGRPLLVVTTGILFGLSCGRWLLFASQNMRCKTAMLLEGLGAVWTNDLWR